MKLASIASAVAALCFAVAPAAAEPHSFKLAGVQFHVALPEGLRFIERTSPKSTTWRELVLFRTREKKRLGVGFAETDLQTFTEAKHKPSDRERADLIAQGHQEIPTEFVSEDTFFGGLSGVGDNFSIISVMSDIGCGVECRLEVVVTFWGNKSDAVSIARSIAQQVDAMK